MNENVTLVDPNIERDAPESYKWLQGEIGKETLRLMGNPEQKIAEPTLEEEKERMRSYIEDDSKLVHTIAHDGMTVGIVWADFKEHEGVSPPSVHIMIWNKDVRGMGIGPTSLKLLLDELWQIDGVDTVYSRHLVTNEGSENLLNGLGFVYDSADSYTDDDGLS